LTDMLELGPRPENLEDFALQYFNKVQEISRQIHRKFGTVEAEDIEQGIWEAVVKNFDQAFSGLDADSAHARLYRLGMNYQNSEDVDNMYFSGNYFYSPKEVRMKLSTCAWAEAERCPDIDAKVDLNLAFAALPSGQRMALFKRYGLKVPVNELSEAERKASNRGADGITNWLNRKDKVKALRLDEELDREEAEEYLHSTHFGSPNGEEYR
jgi:hypothetical protein